MHATDLLLTALALKPTDVVADIGAGTGFFSFPMARVVPQGKVLAVAGPHRQVAGLGEGQVVIGGEQQVGGVHCITRWAGW